MKAKFINVILWLYLWPIVLIGFVLDLRIRLTSHPERLKLENHVHIHYLISEWLRKKNVSLGNLLWSDGIIDRSISKIPKLRTPTPEEIKEDDYDQIEGYWLRVW